MSYATRIKLLAHGGAAHLQVRLLREPCCQQQTAGAQQRASSAAGRVEVGCQVQCAEQLAVVQARQACVHDCTFCISSGVQAIEWFFSGKGMPGAVSALDSWMLSRPARPAHAVPLAP